MLDKFIETSVETKLYNSNMILTIEINYEDEWYHAKSINIDYDRIGTPEEIAEEIIEELEDELTLTRGYEQKYIKKTDLDLEELKGRIADGLFIKFG